MQRKLQHQIFALKLYGDFINFEVKYNNIKTKKDKKSYKSKGNKEDDKSSKTLLYKFQFITWHNRLWKCKNFVHMIFELLTSFLKKWRKRIT